MSNLPALNFNVAALQAYSGQSSMGDFGDNAGSPRVQLKGGQINFLGEDGKPLGNRMASNGQVVSFPQYVNAARVIIVGMSPSGSTNYRQWFANNYVEGSSELPDCWSADGIAPNPKSHLPQSSTCAQCPKNITGTSSTGRGKACGSRKRLAVIFADDPDMTVFQVDLSGTALYGTSAREADGYFTLSGYAKYLKANNVAWECIETEMAFSEGSNIGVRFKAIRALTPDRIERAFQCAALPDTHQMLAMDYPVKQLPVHGAAPAATTPTQTVAPVLPPPIAPQQIDPKVAMLNNPQLPAALREWGAQAGVTAEALRAQAALWGVQL